MDENTQAGRKGLLYANQKGIPVIIMEPLRGGKLVSRLPEKAVEIFSDYPIKQTPAQWAFKWLWSQPEVTCVLSGMNSLEMVRDNVATASNVKIGEVGEREEAMLKQVVQAINAKMKVGCTGCGYCMPCPQNVEMHCPQHIEIRKELKNAKRHLETPVYKLGRWLVKCLKAY